MLKNKLVDGIIDEPLGGAHVNYEEAFGHVKAKILETLPRLDRVDSETRLQRRVKKFSAMGALG